MKNITLNDKTTIPQVGFGTWNLIGKTKIYKALDAALANGYKQIDTAQYYNNEKEIGDYLKEKNIPRDKVYLTTKVWPSNFLKEENFKKSVKQSLQRLQVEKVDLILLHWAISEKDSVQAYKWLEEMKDKGLTTSIGVSNFNIKRLEAILRIAKHKPVVNQVQFDLKNQQVDLSHFCRENNIAMQGYSLLKPYLNSTISNEEKQIVDLLASKYQKTWSQILLRWTIQENYIIFPKSQNPERIRENIEIFDFELTIEEMNSLRKMNDPTLKQKMNEIADELIVSILQNPMLYENHYTKNDQGKLVEDTNENNYK